MAAERLQKLLAAAGFASRRAAEELIQEGRVTVNGRVVTELGTKADLSTDHVKVDGKLVRLPERHRYLLLNKPRGVIVTRDDPEGRRSVADLLANRVPQRVVPAGRLDVESEGLLVLTDDGALVHKITHPSGGCRKEYEVKVSGIPAPGDLVKLRRGVVLDGRRTAPAEVELVETTPERDGVGGNAWLRVTLTEGRSRQVRRMLEAVGHPVSKLRRVAIGPVRDRSLPPGQFRDLTPEEVRGLLAGGGAGGARRAAMRERPRRPSPASAGERRRPAVGAKEHRRPAPGAPKRRREPGREKGRPR